MYRDALKKRPISGDLIVTQKTPKPLILKTNPGGFEYKYYLNKIQIYDQLQLGEKNFILVKTKLGGPLIF